MLVQKGHLVAFESRKLYAAKQRYNTHEKEMTTIMHCLETWKHYLMGTRFIVVTDNVANISNTISIVFILVFILSSSFFALSLCRIGAFDFLFCFYALKGCSMFLEPF